jgi:hypothetical protein
MVKNMRETILIETMTAWNKGKAEYRSKTTRKCLSEAKTKSKELNTG